MNEPIRGKVARVLNEREIAINKGTADGATIGMYFDVMEVHNENIIDPDTGEVLGPIERSKVRVEVTHVQEKLSVATTYQSEKVNLGGSGRLGITAMALGPFARSLMPPKWVKKYETLKKTDKDLGELNEEDSYVNIGDLVVQVIEEVDTEVEVLAENTEASNPAIED